MDRPVNSGETGCPQVDRAKTSVRTLDLRGTALVHGGDGIVSPCLRAAPKKQNDRVAPQATDIRGEAA